MSKSRKIGDIVIKKSNAGFIEESLTLRIPKTNLDEVSNCWLGCCKKGCKEWPTLEVLDKDNNIIGYCYHVNECEMEDI